MQNNEYELPVAFYFKVEFMGIPPIGSIAFKEVSGLSWEIETENIKIGGLNDAEYKLPVRTKHPNLILKRPILPLNSIDTVLFNQWILSVVNWQFDTLPINTMIILVKLLNSNATVLHSWTCEDAYPIKYNIENFDSMKNELAFESVEFAYSSLKQIK